MSEADTLVNAVLANQRSPTDGSLANDLLRCFHRGYPLRNLERLLSSGDERVVETGMWITSELGVKATPLLCFVVPLLRHPSKKVRFFGIDSVLTCATPVNEAELASVIPLLLDKESAVRWKTLEFLSLASKAQLEAALSHTLTLDSSSPHIHGLRWLLSKEAEEHDSIIAFLQSTDSLNRKYGCVGAARLSGQDRRPLLYGASVNDPDVKEFAAGMLRIIG